MAKIDIKDTIAYDRDVVYETFRDKLIELQPHLPDIEKIEQTKYERDGDDVHIVNIWHASEDEVPIPSMAQKFIKPEMLKWTDRATWHDDSNSCDWDMEVGFMSKAISCSGTTYYREKGDRTEVHITGSLNVDAKELGVPRIIAGKVGEAVESVVVRMITPNLTKVNRGAEKYLADQ